MIQEKLREKLREEASGVYSVTAWFWHNPSEIQDEGRIMFTCAPERVDELIALSERVLTEFEHNGIDRQVFRNKIVQSRNILERTHNSVTGILEDIERSYMLTGGPLLIGASLRAMKRHLRKRLKWFYRTFYVMPENSMRYYCLRSNQ